MEILRQIPWGEILLYLHTIAVVVCAVRVLYKQRNIGSTLAWLILLFVVPFVGVLLYLLIGEPRLGTARSKRTAEMNRFYAEVSERYLADVHLAIRDDVSPHYRGISHVSAGVTGLYATKHNHLSLLHTTDSILEAMLYDVTHAQETCVLAFYIIDPQGRIETLLEAVEAASVRGVGCIVMADAVGSEGFFKSGWPARLQAAGVKVQKALPVGIWRTLFTRTDLRNHRKILIVDKKVGYTGSFNLVDPRYFKQNAGVGEWVDVMMRCTGPLVLEMAAVFYADIAVEGERNLSEVQKYLTGFVEQVPQMLPDKIGGGNVVAQVIPSAPNQSERVIYDTIICAIHAAERRLLITTPYFVPDEPLLQALTTAARRGVEVTLILPAKVDSLMVRYASRAYYPLLLEAGVNIALYEGGLLHAKTLTVDEDYALFGTVNMDMRSFFLNLEISLAIYDRDMTAAIAARQLAYLADSRMVNAKAWQQRSKWWILVENTVRLMSPLL
ncbi:MAG: cardiolipin synthase [Neisseria sp.]|nr:cardiolipin synthase [Neisseria sp.]